MAIKVRAENYRCRRCGTPFHFKVRRSRFMKLVSYFFPLQKFFCAKCKKASYVFIK